MKTAERAGRRGRLASRLSLALLLLAMRHRHSPRRFRLEPVMSREKLRRGTGPIRDIVFQGLSARQITPHLLAAYGEPF